MYGLAMRDSPSVFCEPVSTILFMSSMYSTLLILSMTFDRFYSIISSHGELYYWPSFILNFVLPFCCLLIMNSFIIHALRKRYLKFTAKKMSNEGQGQDGGQSSKNGASERQIYVILLLVTPYMYVLVLHILSVDYNKSAYSYAAYYLSYQIVQKSYFTNYGINFFLYVTSGKSLGQNYLNY